MANITSKVKWMMAGTVTLAAFDCALIGLRVHHPIDSWPWAYLLCWWSAVVVSSVLVQRATERWLPRHSRHWTILCLGCVVGCSLASSYLPIAHGSVLGAMIGLGCATASPRRFSPVVGTVLMALWGGSVFLENSSLLPVKQGSPSSPDIILVTIDTVREDALSSSPNALIAGLTPTLDQLAETGCYISEASAASPLTGPSHAALLSGQHPLELGLFKNGQSLPTELPWLPETLLERGYQTAAFVSSAMLDGSLGYSRGFETFDDDQSGTAALEHSTLSPLFPGPTLSHRDSFSRHGADTIDRMALWLNEADPNRPIFLWLHLYDAHRPYVASADSIRFVENARIPLPAPESFDQWTAPETETKHPSIAKTIFSDLMQTAMNTTLKQGPESMPLKYLAGVRDLDALVGKAWRQIDAHRLQSGRVWAVVADHGESLTEHGELGSHQHNVYEANLRVPYILSPGSCPSGPISTVGVAGALLQRAQIDHPWPSDHPLDSVVKVGKKAPTHPSMFKVSRRVGDQKVIVGIKNGQSTFTETYDLATDRHEQRPLPHTPESLTSFFSDVRTHLTDVPAEHTDASVQEALRALGYIDEDQ
jgi:hypothetical protein